MSTKITVVGNVGSDPEIRFLQSGQPVTSFSLADTLKRKNEQTGQWEDANTTWYRISIWDKAAENAMETLRKGDRVIVTGSIQNRKYQHKETGEDRYSLEIRADEVGPSLRWASGTITKNPRDGQGGGGFAQGGIQQQAQQQGGWGAPPQGQQQQDPWGGGQQQAFAAQGQGGGWDQAPF